MFKRFLSDPYLLPRYYAASIAVLSVIAWLASARLDLLAPSSSALWIAALIPVAMGGLLTLAAATGAFIVALLYWHAAELAAWHAALPALGVITGLYSATVMHMCAHNALRPRWLNRWIGELCAMHQLIGYYGWAVPHILHHKFPDHPEWDPHPPANKSFLAYAGGMKENIVKSLSKAYFIAFGDNRRTRSVWTGTKVLLVVNRMLRATVWLLLLGPVGFTLFYLPSFLAQMIFYIHFNWATHRETDDGESVIVNLTHGLYYRVMNAMLFGMYYHKNHHLRPAAINPAHVRLRKELPLRSRRKDAPIKGLEDDIAA